MTKEVSKEEFERIRKGLEPSGPAASLPTSTKRRLASTATMASQPSRASTKEIAESRRASSKASSATPGFWMMLKLRSSAASSSRLEAPAASRRAWG